MSGKNYFLDTNIVVPFLNGDHIIVEKVKNIKVVYLPIIVLGELYYGATKSLRQEQNLKKVDDFKDRCEIYLINESVAIIYGKLKSELARKGTPIPENDIWIAAIALEHDLPVVTRDKHFGSIPNLEVIEW